MNRQENQKTIYALFGILSVFVIWLALMVAGCYEEDIKLFELLDRLTTLLTLPQRAEPCSSPGRRFSLDEKYTPIPIAYKNKKMSTAFKLYSFNVMCIGLFIEAVKRSSNSNSFIFSS